MKNSLFFGASTAALAFAAMAACPAASAAALDHHVLLISIDGMHALDFANCSGQSGGAITCPNLAALAKTGLVYTQASTSKPSDSFPGLTALATGGTPKSTGAFYDVSYDRALSPPAKTTPYGIRAGRTFAPRSSARRSASTRKSISTTNASTPVAASIPPICRAIRRMAARRSIRTISFR